MATRNENLDRIRNAMGSYSPGTKNTTRMNGPRYEETSRDESLRILQSALSGGTAAQGGTVPTATQPEITQPEITQPPVPSTASGAVAPPSPQGEGRSAEQIQQEISDSRKRLEQLQLESAYILTVEPGAELGRQMDEERARIKALNKELDALKAPSTNAERDSLIQRMNAITENEGYATTVELADAVTQEKQDTRQRLHQLDEELGNAARFYDSGERAGAVIKGALKQTGSAYTNFMGTLQGLGNRLHEASSAADQAVAGSDYAGWATDELTAANMAQAIMKENPDGNYLEGLQKEEQRLYEKADTMSESAAKDIEQAKEGLSALGKAGVDISTNLIQNGIDAAGKAAGLGMLPFFVRAAGGASMDARHEGASTGQQVFYGITEGVKEVATELISGGIAGTGISGLDKVVEPLIDKLAKSTAGKIALNAIYDAAMEGGEEVLSDLLDPFAKLIYNDQAVKEAWENRAEVGSQMLYDYLIGAVVGSIGSGTKIVTGVATRQNTENNTKLGGTETQEPTTQPAAATQAKPYQTVEELIQPIQPARNTIAAEPAAAATGGNAPANGGVQATDQGQTAGQQVMTREERAQKEADWWANREKEAEKAYEDAKKRYEEALNGGNADETDFLSSPEMRKVLMDMAKKDLEDVRNRKIPSPFSTAEAQTVSGELNTQNGSNASQSSVRNNVPLQQNIDNGGTTAYNNNRITNGGAEDGIRTAGLQQDDAGRSAEANRRGIPGVYQYSNSDNSGWGRSGEVPVGTGFVLISENARKRLNERGVAVVEARDASSDKAAFSSALESARANDPDNGWAVTPKSAEELEQSGARLLMDERGSAGLAVTPDGDIEAVFANHAAGAPKGATKSLIPMAIANGGKKLDCYGIDLVKLYAQYGFTPVARVKFDPEYANPGWDSSKGTPDIYFLIHNGDSADSVVDKIGTYPIPTAEELHALPEMDYDSAYEYRDRLLAETAQEAQRATAMAETPTTTQNAAQTASGELNTQAEMNAQEQVENAEADAQFNELAERYGAIPTGETPARDVQVPQRISEEEAVGRTARTIMEAAATPDNRLGSVREAVVDGKFSYTEISNQELADGAAQRIESDGWQKSLTDWTAAVRQNQANENLAAMGAQLLNNAGNSDMSAEQYIDLATDYNRLMHNLGRGLAAARILKTLSPEGKLYGVLRSVQSMVDEANGKYNVEIDQALIDEYRAQTTDEGRDAVISKMQQNIADQIPSTWMDKFTALRYTNMLGNFKTQARNISGNILMTLTRTVKDRLAAVIEIAANAASGGQVERTKSLWAGTPLYGEAMRDFTNVEREAMGEAKFSDIGRELGREVQEKRTIFKNNGKWGTDEAKTGIGRSAAAKGARKVSDIGMAGMEAYRKATNWAMEQGDRIFVRINYADALAGWLKAHGISSIAGADADTLGRARQYAIQQAQEATFRDTNSVSRLVSGIDPFLDSQGTRAARVTKTVLQGIAPFRKTPANVAVRAEEYSPLGILNTAAKAFEAKQGKSDVTWSDVIDSAAKTLTGSGIFLLGYLMSAAGSVRGKEEDEKKAAFESMRGLQDYSAILPNRKSVSLDWVAPESIPFFMGVLTQEAVADGGLSWDDAGKIIGAVSDPMLEMSMLSGLNDALDNISKYNGDADALPQFLMNAFASYLSQGLTNSLLGQAEQASQENRQTTYTDSTLKIPTALQYILGKASAKTPGVDYNQQDYIDAWGRKQSTGTVGERIINNFINPAYVNEDRSTPVDDELQRLYDAGQTNVLPQKATRSTKVNGERLSPDEYEAYSITKGQKSLELVQDFIESDAYKDMSDEARAKIISDIYSIAASRAAKEIADGRKESYTSDWDDEAELSDVVGYLASKSQIQTAQDSKDYTLLDALIDTVTEQKKDVQGKLNKDFSMLDELIYGQEHGVGSKEIYTAKEKADANGNGSVTQEELWNYLETQVIMPSSKKSVLWDILTSGKTGYSEYAEKHK